MCLSNARNAEKKNQTLLSWIKFADKNCEFVNLVKDTTEPELAVAATST